VIMVYLTVNGSISVRLFSLSDEKYEKKNVTSSVLDPDPVDP
jgi:hypothetical protein